jgi:hypothetical protein
MGKDSVISQTGLPVIDQGLNELKTLILKINNKIN